MTRSKFFLFSVVLALLSVSAFSEIDSEVVRAQENFMNQFVSRVWTSTDGLPGNTITSVLQDNEGYIYIGMYEGLIRFDGIEFLTINRDLDPKYKLYSARSLFQDSYGNLWVGANDEGAVCIRPDGEVESYTVDAGLPNNSVRAIAEDFDHNIWIGTSDGVVYITPDREILKPNGLEQYDAEHILVLRMYCDTAGRIWCVTEKQNGVYCYSNNKFERYNRITKIKNPVVSCVSQDSSGAFWFGIEPHYAVRVNGVDEVLYDLGGDGEQKGSIVNCIYPDRNGNIWFAKDNGLSVLNNGILCSYENGMGLTDNNINAIIEDREGNLWLGTDRGGLEKLSFSKFTTVPVSTSINAIAQDTLRNVSWLGGDSGLFCYDYNNARFLENEATEFCKNIRIRDVHTMKDGSVLISTYEKLGLVKYAPDGTLSNWTVKDGLIGMKVRVAVEASSGDIYVGTTLGLSIINHETGTISSLTKEDGLINDYIMCVYEDDSGKIWCGTDGGGVFVLDGSELIKTYTTKEGLSGNVVFKIDNVGNDSDIWICTGTGVSRIRNGKFINYNSSNGFSSNSAFQLIKDYTDTVWFTSNRGIGSVKLSQLDAIADGSEQRMNVRYYGSSDGLRSGGITSTSLSIKDNIGRIWFTLIDGFATYDPLKVTNRAVVNVKIQQYYIDNKAYPYIGRDIVLSPNTKRLALDYTALSFVSPELMQFRYKLAGFETEYSSWSMDRTVSYTNLKPGRYEFSVEAASSNDVVQRLSAPLIIIKKPYIWQLWWFWMIISVLVLSTVAFMIYLRFRALKKYQEKLEAEVARQTEELRNKSDALEKANEKSHHLLLNILPAPVADELTEHPDSLIANRFPNVCVLFADIVDFTKLSDGMSAYEIVKLLNSLFSRFDEIALASGIEKIKTIGDAYMAACGLTEKFDNDSARIMINFAKAMLSELEKFNNLHHFNLKMRIGINNGNLIAGVIGKSKFIYDIWGDTVNVASRMESTGKSGCIQVTESTYEQAVNFFKFSPMQTINVKGKGQMKTFFVDG